MGRGQQNPARARPRFRVGHWVAYTVGISRHVCEVTEDCGLVGTRGLRFYRLREPVWYGEPQEYELPETSLEPATPDDLDRRYPPDRQPVDPYAVPDPYDDWAPDCR